MEKKNPGNKSKRVYVIKKGKQVLSWNEFAKIQGIILNNTHNYEELKMHRDSLFENELSKVVLQWNLNKVNPKANDFLIARLEWLKQEILVLNRWDQNADLAAKTQLLQYRKGIEVEIERIELVSKNEKQYSTFKELYDDALHFGLIVHPEPSENLRRRINYDNRFHSMDFQFSTFLREKYQIELKSWEYFQYLTPENLKMLLKRNMDAKAASQKAFESQKSKWKIGADDFSDEQSDDSPNNFMHSTIVDWLLPFKEENRLTETNYNSLLKALIHYFENGDFPKMDNKIKLARVSKKRFGWALNQIFRSCKSENEKLPFEYLNFASTNISIFSKDKIKKVDYLNSNLYKYFTTRTE